MPSVRHWSCTVVDTQDKHVASPSLAPCLAVEGSLWYASVLEEAVVGHRKVMNNASGKTKAMVYVGTHEQLEA